MRTLSDYIQQVAGAIKRENGKKLQECLTLSPGQEEGISRAGYREPSEIDLYPVPERFRSVLTAHLKLMRSVYVAKNITMAFDDLNDMVNNLTRAADSQTKWINVPLIASCSELMTVYHVKSQTHPEDESIEFQDLEIENSKPSSLERLANTINKAFKLSLNDKNLDLSQSKRCDIYFFLGSLIKIYFRLGKLELAKSVEKALKGTRFDLPDLNSQQTRKYAVSYLYYSSLLSLDDAEFAASEQKLLKALEISAYYDEKKNKRVEKILLLLLPLVLYNRKLLPSNEVWDLYPSLRILYKDNLFAAIKTGNIAKFNKSVEEFEGFFLKKHLYLLTEHMKSLCYLELMKNTASFIRSLNQTSKTSHIIPINAFQVALEFSRYHIDSKIDFSNHSFKYSLDEVECILASLISAGKIKGYISHSNRCIVLSKQNAFPSQVVSFNSS